ncbi:MAG TPA: NrfD/PsrC family molybdoenzyme membrane anchor subunit [Planctomycetota bacterium]|nr:NrfD/PsrC family molybdoenzyme membrane anchor subunit [Planctomycetota bacterium]
MSTLAGYGHPALAGALEGPPVLAGRPSDAALNRQLLEPVLKPWGPLGNIAMLLSAGGTGMLLACVSYLFWKGIGALGNNIPVAWGFPITNFVWWIGIGHAGTFISAFLLLLEQRWRASVNRVAEAMTLFAVIQAGLYPLLHLGRPWFAYWLFPYPATMDVWPQFRSALPWDFAAVSTYFTISLLFWYMGLVPDFAALRDSAPGVVRRKVYGVLSLGWRGSASAWSQYRCGYGLLGAFATPLVISVHSVVSSDFAIGLVPGWHSTIFPPYFVAGALYSGFAMVITLVVPIRAIYKLQNVVTERHLDVLAKMLLLTGWIVTFSYMVEWFLTWYGHSPYEQYTHFVGWPLGPYAVLFWITILCNVVVPQTCWFKAVRRTPWVLFIVSILVNVGMWTERFIIVVGSLSHGYLPSKWHTFVPSWLDIAIFAGTMSFFVFLYLCFLRWVPFIPVSETKELRSELEEEDRAARARLAARAEAGAA